jgi:hypothetical protein
MYWNLHQRIYRAKIRFVLRKTEIKLNGPVALLSTETNKVWLDNTQRDIAFKPSITRVPSQASIQNIKTLEYEARDYIKNLTKSVIDVAWQKIERWFNRLALGLQKVKCWNSLNECLRLFS